MPVKFKKTTDSKYINPNFINSYLVTLGARLLASGLFSAVVHVQALFYNGHCDTGSTHAAIFLHLFILCVYE